MAYIEALAPRDWSFCTLFGYPYVEGVHDLGLAFPCCCPTDDPPLSLCQRVAHCGVGLLLIIPLINTIVFIVLRFFQSFVIQDTIEMVDSPLTPRRTEQIATYNQRRNAIVQQLTGSRCNEPIYSQLRQELRTIEKGAAGSMKHEDATLVSEHQKMSLNKEGEMTKWDGVITYTLDDFVPSVRVDGKGIMPSATFTQVGGLTQLKAQNYLCGYYALFFLLNAVTDKDSFHTNRDAFNQCMCEWHKLITTKRMAIWLETHRETDIPHGLMLPGHGLSWDDMQYLINHSDLLIPIREKIGCFMLEMDAYESSFVGEEPVLFFGKSKAEFDTFNRSPKSFPLFIILKETDMHYYLFYARQPGVFQVVHSLNHSISNPECFEPATFTKIIRALTGVKTQLRIKW